MERAMASAVGCALLATGCGGSDRSRTPPADAISLGTTSTTLSENDPPVVIGGAPGADGHLPVRLNPKAWKGIATRMVTDDPQGPYHELHSDGHDDFWFGVELHTVKGPGWTGELGLFATDCVGAGICVRLDPDGGAGPIGPLLAGPTGEVDVEQIENGYSLVFRHLIFTRDDGVTYRIDTVVIDTT
ncbi:MAG: hypothetical protein ACRDHK_15680 [Actinomycetota bacterium]